MPTPETRSSLLLLGEEASSSLNITRDLCEKEVSNQRMNNLVEIEKLFGVGEGKGVHQDGEELKL